MVASNLSASSGFGQNWVQNGPSGQQGDRCPGCRQWMMWPGKEADFNHAEQPTGGKGEKAARYFFFADASMHSSSFGRRDAGMPGLQVFLRVGLLGEWVQREISCCALLMLPCDWTSCPMKAEDGLHHSTPRRKVSCPGQWTANTFRARCLAVLLLVTVLAKSFFAFVRSDLVALALSSTGHNGYFFGEKIRVQHCLRRRRPSMIAGYCRESSLQRFSNCAALSARPAPA